ncbi:hypothetical protein MTBPR1_60143 [Candidatus Terasakiella magnetica]|uniref:Uncharacterized protein n=1 Tax=Candidatus Terasakiella magnetica TaxID=1867952 RepID=A0A1C3RK13_9PROT|nr:hypothetical protein [Candidatus Terasakiella magnetica]SCA57630.1 hypothetical protein MTBPR1_60143 [Candidatus Terasakiella magnetica]
MKMSVSPKEIAEHLIDEYGHSKAVEKYQYHLNRCHDQETTSVWQNIGTAIESMKPLEQCA